MDSGPADSVNIIDPVAARRSGWSRVLRDTMVTGDIIVPQGESWLIGPNVRISGNVRTDGGTIAMRPGSRLQFVGVTPEQYVGGGMRYEDRFKRDWGIWVGGTGVLDIQGTPKVGWNRTGSDPSWLTGDELWISPTDAGDRTPRRWFPGQPIPRISPRVPAAEVMNVTRDIEIRGGHIHISSNQPSIIQYVTLRGMGVFRPNVGSDGATTGRYVLHLHMQGDGSRGMVIQGVAAIDSRGRVYVPHTSHGVTFRDNVSVNSMAEAFWWDHGDQTNDLLVDRLSASGVVVDRSYTGQANRQNVIDLPFGINMTMTNSVASGGAGGRLSSGFEWVTGNRRDDVHWTFANNVAHNNGTGLRFWNNSGQPHHIFDNISYRNGTGLENGAYNNANRYTGLLLFDNGVMQNASSDRSQVDGGPARFTNMHVEVPGGPAMEIGGRNLPGHTYAEFIDSEFHTGDRSPKVLVGARANPWFAHFIRTNILPGDIAWDLRRNRNDGSRVLIDHSDGRKWEIRVEGRRVVVKQR